MKKTGYCEACRVGPYDYIDTDGKAFCTMCYTSPFYTNQRRKRMEEKTPDLRAGPVGADGKGQRLDDGKSRVDLFPGDALLELGHVYRKGAEKYAPRNWERGMPWSKMIGPLLRHLFKWMAGHTIDEETGQRHIAMVVWNAVGLLTYELRGIGEDDRAKLEGKK